MSVTFPNETQDYRSARSALLQHEVALRREMEAVAAELRSLPPGGEVPEDYVFVTASARTARQRRCACPRCSAAATR